jgi:hypothetical protein
VDRPRGQQPNPATVLRAETSEAELALRART